MLQKIALGVVANFMSSCDDSHTQLMLDLDFLPLAYNVIRNDHHVAASTRKEVISLSLSLSLSLFLSFVSFFLSLSRVIMIITVIRVILSVYVSLSLYVCSLFDFDTVFATFNPPVLTYSLALMTLVTLVILIYIYIYRCYGCCPT